MNLVIVESPAKTKTISKYLPKGYVVRASIGHIRDLPKSNKKAIDIEAGFVPRYETIKGKEKIISEIKNESQKAKEIILATDPDREGEAIAFHLIEALGLQTTDYGSQQKQEIKKSVSRKPLAVVRRITFNEITESAVNEALKHPREIDMDLVRAQEARRVLDRLVGYDLSGLIWKKVRYGLSAGRVQSPALRIIMEKEREIRAFIPEDYWIITGEFETKKKEKITLTCEEQPKNEKEANRIIEVARENKWQVTGVNQTETKRSPRPPFITATLQQTASSRFGYSPSRTMFIAQKLYEQGLITYMRTDSVNLSKEVLPQIYSTIEKDFGKNYLSPRTYASKSKNSQEAHEAIRPASIGKKSAGATDEQKRIYKLIWDRTVASQMADAKILRTKIIANIVSGEQLTADSGRQDEIPDFSANGSVIVFPGWLKVDTMSRGEDVELPDIKKGEDLKLLDISGEGKQTEPPPRYTEAGLIKELEKREIGRPSTYAAIIKTIQDRNYVNKDGKTLKPTDTGEVVSDFLEQNFAKYISDSFTAEMENELDEIATGKRKYEKMLSAFYRGFLKDVKEKEKTAGKITDLGEADEKFKCPVCNGPMIIKLSRNGKFLSCKDFPKCSGARKFDGSIMEGPKETGEACPKCEGKLIEREGRFGKFISCSNYPKCKFIKKTAEQEAKEKTGVKCPQCANGEIVERRGRFGLFFSCSNYPDCKFIMKSRPTGNICKLCNSLMMQGAKTIPERCNDKNCPNYRPDKFK
ncbi:type I DNA topoisomerase [Candidatus Wolfebacteria bacterium]|nr:type I DNA topoisomerase [Candidatus Wolfebacteria bacterium]